MSAVMQRVCCAAILWGLPIMECTMRIRLTFVAPLLVAGAAVVAVSAAPIAAAAPVNPPAQQSCATSGPGTLCQSPGNVQINDAPPPVSFYPYGGEAGLL
ncbi:MAG: hypothetical protein JWR13_2631 [Mycobacterium sp.]|jgi:hypothetical protein|nr:hypothetical protein [Mycobacterium sp.]